MSWSERFDHAWTQDWPQQQLKEFIGSELSRQKEEIVNEAKKAIRKLLRASNDALDTTYIREHRTGELLSVPKGNNTEDSYYNLALIEAEEAIGILAALKEPGEEIKK